MRRVFVALISCLLFAAGASAEQPAPGDPAPEFRLQDQNSDWHSLADYQGQWVVLYFYPKNDTPGCTTEACAFRDDIFKFRKLGAQILGVSLDPVESHAEFAARYSLPFPLLSDAEKQAAGQYGVLRMMGLYTKRETFVIAPDGTIAMHYRKVDPDTHSAQVLADLGKLMNPDG